MCARAIAYLVMMLRSHSHNGVSRNGVFDAYFMMRHAGIELTDRINGVFYDVSGGSLFSNRLISRVLHARTSRIPLCVFHKTIDLQMKAEWVQSGWGQQNSISVEFYIS